jgi:hypothetical protein
MQFAAAMGGCELRGVVLSAVKEGASIAALPTLQIEDRYFVATLLRMTGRTVWMLGRRVAGGRFAGGCDNFSSVRNVLRNFGRIGATIGVASGLADSVMHGAGLGDVARTTRQ